MALPLKWMPAYSHGGAFGAGQPTVIVVHSTESDNTPGSAEANAGPGWFGGPKAGTSAHKIVDVDSICEGVKRNIVAYHVGPGGNGRGIAYEFCGKAGWTAAKWREPAQLQMLRNAAPHIADDLVAITGSKSAAISACRWLSLAQLGGGQRGLCTHNDIRLVFGGTTHSDPGPNFPYAELLSYVLAALGGNSLEDNDMTPEQDQRLRNIERALGAEGAAGAVPMKVEDTILFRVRDLTAAIGAEGAAKIKLPLDETTLGVLRDLRTNIDKLVSRGIGNMPA